MSQPNLGIESYDVANRANAEYIDSLYLQYQRDPRSVSPQWQAFFAGFDLASGRGGTPGGTKGERPPDEGLLTTGVHDLVHSYRELGHFIARLDPLGHDRSAHALLNLSEFGLSTADLEKQAYSGGFAGPFDGTLRDLLDKLRQTYCGTFGMEMMDIPDKHQREWLINRIEPILNHPQLSEDEAHAILFQLVASETLEQFLGTRYIGQKRFSLEGAESLIPMLNTLIEDGSRLGVEEAVMAMAHRGRLNVLAHVMNKPYETILSEFEGTIKAETDEGDGDVKYHLGYSSDRPASGGKPVHLLLCPNPSHLELVNPVMQGIVRAKQTLMGDRERNRVVPITMHGDAAFTGQGIVPETLGLSELPGYRTGGTINVIINNQIGFTATPRQTRFTPYPTDIAKSIQAPILHVNGDDPEACVHASKLAIEFRERFKVDVMIDLWCYRRHGHNETDEPGFTQPLMYKEIAKKKTTAQLYAERLISEGRLTQEHYDDMRQVVTERLTAAQERAKELKPRQRNISLGPVWKGFSRAARDWSAQTAVSREALEHVVRDATKLPESFTPHPKIVRVLNHRKQMVESGAGIDWGCAEMLAMGTLLLEKHWVRVTGQDVERGTFSHRHAILYDYENGSRYVPLAHLSPDQGHIIIANTMLSELAVLGFEYGYTLADPTTLVVWEAQFGDFVNGAQPIIDQFLVAGESKWQLMSGLVMLLPHGYEGQGPEHSNAYVERFLDLCAEDNIQVIMPTSPAQYFHALRRQIHRKFRKPLISFMPKSLLRYEPSFSHVEALTSGGFEMVVDDQLFANPNSEIRNPKQIQNPNVRETVRRVLLCAGKVYYTLDAARSKQPSADVAIVRVEQLYPFPQVEIAAIVEKYPRVEEIAWVQEEPQNRGGWRFMEPRLRESFADKLITYFGRESAASPATGSFKAHQAEEKELVAAALAIHPRAVPAGQIPATSAARGVSD